MNRQNPRVLVVLILLLSAVSAGAQQIILNVGSVIGGGPELNNAKFDSGPFNATQVVDEQTGTIGTEVFGQKYWLGANAATTGYFVLDLGSAVQIGQISLFNTHNAVDGNDRSTNTFHVSAANSVTFVNTDRGFDLVAGTTILSGALAFPTDPLAENIFTSANGLTSGGTAFRFISFTYDSIAGPSGSAGNGGGLHEIRVFTAVPEPSTYALFGGVAAGAVALLRRRRGIA